MHKFIYLVFFIFLSCSAFGPEVSIDSTFDKNMTYKIGVIPISIEGYPGVKTNSEVNNYLSRKMKQNGFDVVDNVFINSWLSENSTSNISSLKKMQDDLNLDAILFSNASYRYVPAQSKSDSYVVPQYSNYSDSTQKSNSNVSSSSFKAAYYEPTSLSIKLINTKNQVILFEGYKSTNNLNFGINQILKKFKSDISQ